MKQRHVVFANFNFIFFNLVDDSSRNDTVHSAYFGIRVSPFSLHDIRLITSYSLSLFEISDINKISIKQPKRVYSIYMF